MTPFDSVASCQSLLRIDTRHARLTRMRVGINTVTSRLDTNQSDTWVLDKVVECSNGITATSDTGDDGVGKFASPLSELRLDFTTNDSLEISNNGGEGVGTDGRSDQVVSSVKTSNPFSHGLVDGVFKCLRSGCDRDDLTLVEVEDQV